MKRKMGMPRVYWFGIVLFTATASCTVDPLPGRTLCEAHCYADSDCQPGLLCLGDLSSGKNCLPREVASCSGMTPTATYYATTPDGGDISCAFVACVPAPVCNRMCEAASICPSEPAVSICVTVCERSRQSTSACLAEQDAFRECFSRGPIECSPINGEATIGGCGTEANAANKCLASDGGI